MTEALFERLKIDSDPEAEVGDLSVANRQMVEIAKAVSYDTDIPIMDEPTSALTERVVEHMFEIIRDLRDQGHRHRPSRLPSSAAFRCRAARGASPAR